MSVEAPDLAARLASTAAEHGDRTAILWQDVAITYAELDRRATAAAGLFQHLGIAPGDRVAIMVGNTPQFVEAHFGALRAGATVVPVNTGLTRHEVEHILRDSGARVCVVLGAVASSVLDVADAIDALEHVIVANTSDVPEGALGRWRDLRDEDHPFTPVERNADDLAALVYTSGTTGAPKGAMLTRANLAANQDQSLSGRFRIETDDVVLLVLPLFHIYALNVGLGACVRTGATMVVVERFDPTGSLDLIEEHGITVILGAPPMYIAWLNTPGVHERDLGSVRIAASGAAALPPHVFDAFERDLGVTIWEGYGLTEAGPSVTSNAVAEAPRRRSVGLPLPGLEIRLVDENGRDVEVGDPGEVWVRGPTIYQGYFGLDEATRSARTDDGWLRTGDIGTQDEDGYLYLVDRKDDLIIVSGFNVYPREVEAAINTHPDVQQCAVVGVAHPYTGEAVKAFVVPEAGRELSEDDIAVYCRSRLARYKCPETIEIVEALPHTATGKIKRAELRAS